MPSPDTKVLSSRQDISVTPTISTELSTTTKCLGTYRTMASPTASTHAAAPTPPPAGVRQPKPLGPPNLYRPVSPPSSHHSDGGPDVAAKFTFSVVILLRAVAIAFAITLVVLEVERRRGFRGLGAFPVVFAVFQLFWLVFAILRDLGRLGGCGGRSSKGLTVDMGFVKCIFGRRGHYDDDDEQGQMLLGWAPGDSGKKKKKKKWNEGLLVTAVDLVFAAISLAVGMVIAGSHSYPSWIWDEFVAVCATSFVVAGLELVIAIAQQFRILKRAKIRISYAEEGDEGAHKYRIRLPESPESGTGAPMTVAAHAAI